MAAGTTTIVREWPDKTKPTNPPKESTKDIKTGSSGESRGEYKSENELATGSSQVPTGNLESAKAEVTRTTNVGSYSASFVHPSKVGGVVVPVDKLSLLAPYIGLASTILAATVASTVYVKRVKRRKEKQ